MREVKGAGHIQLLMLLPAAPSCWTRGGVVREGYTVSYLASATHLTASGSLLPAWVGVVREGYRSTQLNNLLLLAASGCWQGWEGGCWG